MHVCILLLFIHSRFVWLLTLVVCFNLITPTMTLDICLQFPNSGFPVSTKWFYLTSRYTGFIIITVSATILSISHIPSHLIIITTQKLDKIAVPILKMFTIPTKYYQPVKLTRVIYQGIVTYAWSLHMTDFSYSVSNPSRVETDTSWLRAQGKQKQTSTINQL